MARRVLFVLVLAVFPVVAGCLAEPGVGWRPPWQSRPIPVVYPDEAGGAARVSPPVAVPWWRPLAVVQPTPVTEVPWQ